MKEETDFYASYGNEALEKVQSTLWEILLQVDSIFEKNNIRYFLSYGTLLGAVRHKGFIPWDDDLDICVFEEDYVKGIQLLREQLDHKYIVHDEHTDAIYWCPFSKLRLKESETECVLWPEDNKLKFKSSSSCLNDTLNKYKSHLNFIDSHNKAIKAKNDFIKLSDEEISSYSMLSYNEKISLLNNTNYSLEDRIHIFLGSDLENFSLVYYNISTKEKVSINENKEFKPASTYKLGLNALIYNLSLNGKLNLNDTITFENCDYEDGVLSLQLEHIQFKNYLIYQLYILII